MNETQRGNMINNNKYTLTFFETYNPIKSAVTYHICITLFHWIAFFAREILIGFLVEEKTVRRSKLLVDQDVF